MNNNFALVFSLLGRYSRIAASVMFVLLTSLQAEPAEAAFPAPPGTWGSCTVPPCQFWTQNFNRNIPLTDEEKLQWGDTKLEALFKWPGPAFDAPFTFQPPGTQITWYGNNPSLAPTVGWSLQGGFLPRPKYACPANSTLTGSACTCNTGYAEQLVASVYSCIPAPYVISLGGPTSTKSLHGSWRKSRTWNFCGAWF